MEAQLARGPLQRRGRLVVDGGRVRVHYPKWREPWSFDAGAVTFVLADPTESLEPTRRPGDVSVVFPRIELVRIHDEKATNLYLVPTAPAQVPETDPSRWCDVIALTVSTRAFEELRTAPVARAADVEDALCTLYGTTSAPRLRPDQMQTDWHVEGLALVGRGGWSADPRPVARSSGPAPESVRRTEERHRRYAVALGIAAAVVGALVWAVAAHYAPDHAGQMTWLVAFLIGISIRAPRWHVVRSDQRLALLAVVLTVVSVALGVALVNVAEIAAGEGASLVDTAISLVQQHDWASLFGGWFDTWGGWIAVALSCVIAYGTALSGSPGSATRAS